MRLLEYVGLDTAHAPAAYAKVVAAIERDDFRSADVKKLTQAHGQNFYRARLDHTNRLLLTFVRYRQETCALALELIEQHAYEKSRFLRGASIDESRIPPVEVMDVAPVAQPMRYLHAQHRRVQFLDKPLSFDQLQQSIYTLPAPLIVVGSAGSGKTALTLEKLKCVDGDVLYVTQSAYLAKNAREIYYAHGYEQEAQDAQFLSYREFVETLHVPVGREATWRDFAAWFARQKQSFKGVDAHQAFEEIRGVIAAQAGGVLTREAYCGLGVRQSIFIDGERERIFQLFERYRAWLAEASLYDLGLLAHEWLQYAAPRYDFVVIDEVQDLTAAQLALVLGTLKTADRFMLCGDSNQIVHPNFFSWSQIKTLFWHDPEVAAQQQLRVLSANFRNSTEATRVANTLLKIKHRRFGSIDRESNFLVSAVGDDPGAVTLLPDRESYTRALDEQTRSSARCAVLVLRDEDKAEARSRFRTPLVFAVHEAKGLEYEHIVLYRFISGNRSEYAQICAGVVAGELGEDSLEYRRARDKSDKSLEIYKFYVNALYVALTRALRNIYIVESDTEHPLLELLGVTLIQQQVHMDAQASSREEWQMEARKLDLQGKQEQADAIRQNILKEMPVPWPVFGEARLRETLIKVFRDRVPGSKPRQQLEEYAACYGESYLAARLGGEAGRLRSSEELMKMPLARKHYAAYGGKSFKEILRQCDTYGVEHRNPMNQTPLMAAAIAGNVPLVDALLQRGADVEATDHLGRGAVHWALQRAFADAQFAGTSLAPLYERIAPPSIDFQAGERLVRVDRRLTEYLLLQTLWTLFRSSFPRGHSERWGFSAATILDAWRGLPTMVLRTERNQRAHVSAVLARNEVERDYAWNRQLFIRMSKGWYQFNPALSIRVRQGSELQWQPIFSALNLPLVHEMQSPVGWEATAQLWQSSAGTALPVPVLWEHLPMLKQRATSAMPPQPPVSSDASPKPAEVAGAQQPAIPWGTRQARKAEMERLARRIDANSRVRKGGGDDPVE